MKKLYVLALSVLLVPSIFSMQRTKWVVSCEEVCCYAGATCALGIGLEGLLHLCGQPTLYENVRENQKFSALHAPTVGLLGLGLSCCWEAHRHYSCIYARFKRWQAQKAAAHVPAYEPSMNAENKKTD